VLGSLAFVKTKPELEVPDLQLHFVPANGDDKFAGDINIPFDKTTPFSGYYSPRYAVLGPELTHSSQALRVANFVASQVNR